ncbi:YbaK/EbsC family protein [Fictibacillus nanhaiensis]|uniref:aminoacyl-tRNA deacylase n=1 Tax=Fictibacillus nanhaiensis TaxID=742169 RepID=UPI001C95820B|nr:YbaK/EbsC family protein [Fictibacillus nanhaiensis]
MNEYDTKITKEINRLGIHAQHYILNDSCHSVEEAANEMNVSPNLFVKNICMIGEKDEIIIAIVKGQDMASTSHVGKVLNTIRPRLANEAEILEKTGFPAGGVPSFGFPALFLIDQKVTELTYIYTGGGTPYSLVKIAVADMIKVNNGRVARVRR